MQIILLDKVVNLGNLGDIVKVKDGYARNFLIPSGRARRATEAAKAEFEARRAELEKQAAEKLAAAQALGDKLNGQTIKLTQKAGVDGRLFGSVTNHDIADELKKQGFDVHKSQVRLPNGPIKVVGDNTVTVALHRAFHFTHQRAVQRNSFSNTCGSIFSHATLAFFADRNKISKQRKSPGGGIGRRTSFRY